MFRTRNNLATLLILLLALGVGIQSIPSPRHFSGAPCGGCAATTNPAQEDCCGHESGEGQECLICCTISTVEAVIQRAPDAPTPMAPALMHALPRITSASGGTRFVLAASTPLFAESHARAAAPRAPPIAG